MGRKVGPWLEKFANSNINPDGEISPSEIAHMYDVTKQAVSGYLKRQNLRGVRKEKADKAGRLNSLKYFRVKDILEHYKSLQSE